MARSPQKPKGFVLIAMCATLFLLMAMIGLAFDLGRVYIVRNEAQVFTDAAAMTAARTLDGTDAGLSLAREAVTKLPAHWNFGTSSFSGVTVEFSADASRWFPEAEKIEDPASIHYVRVRAPSNVIPITFLRATGGPDNFNVAAYSVAQSNPVRLTE